jgi:phosphate-selective porin OprO/OprP
VEDTYIRFLLTNQEAQPLKLKLSSLAVAGVILGTAVMPAHASNDAMMSLLKVLRDQGTITEQNYLLLVNAAKADEAASDATVASVAKIDADVKQVAEKLPKITTKGKIKIADSDGNWSFQPIGRVMWDAIDTDEDNSAADEVHGTELRRARLGLQGSIYDWGYKFEADFAGGDSSIKDAYLSYGTKLGDNKAGVKLGQSHIAFGLTAKISSKYMSFMDRPLFSDSTVSPTRESGAALSLAAADYRWSLAASLTNGSIDDGGTNNNGSTFAARASYIPFMQDKNHMLQVGAGYLTKGGGDEFRFRQRLVSHEDTTRHLDTGTVNDFDGADAFTVDAMAIMGPFHAMAEYLDYSVERTTANASDIDIDGYALEAGYFLTGESLKWKNGYTSGIAPASKSGAWQIAARFESTEIDGNTSSTTDEADKWTVGINYYPTQNTRLMLNYDKVTDVTKNGVNVDFEPSSLKFRAQAYW